MKKPLNYVMELPNVKIVLIFIFCGLPWDLYSAWCLYWHIGYCNFVDYDAIVEDEMKDKSIAKMIELNRQRLASKNKLVIIKKVRLNFDFPEIADQIVEALSQTAANEDPGKLKMPSAFVYFLRNHRMRKFIETALLVRLVFHEINRLWLQFNPVGIRRDYFEIFEYFLWNVRSMTNSELREFFKWNGDNAYYRYHHKVLGGDVNQFLGCWGLEDREVQNRSIYKMTSKISNNISNASEGASKELFSLQNSCTSQIVKNEKMQFPNQPIPSEFLGNPTWPIKPDMSEAAFQVRNINREYRFQQLFDIIKKRGEDND
ncbi:MAG: hypothetical protein KAS53_03455 [Candidatus Cloacimonetes bacterium]|nr:hypothetical protein [Candidatus Cloacimonadota bacterium]